MNLPALTKFLADLEANNNRPWFARHKPAYDILREEFTELTAELIQRVAKFDPDLPHVDPKKALFRIYRDVRFAKDKSPFKTQFSALIGDKKAQDGAPWYYFQIDHKGMLMMGGGIYQPEKDVITKVRRRLADDPKSFSKLLANTRFKRSYGKLWDEEKLARPPKGFDAEMQHIEAIKNKHFVAIIETDVKKSPPADLVKSIADKFEDVKPLVVWLRETLA